MKPLNENERLAALKSYKVLDTLPEEQFDRLTELASVICGVPITLVSLIDTDRQWFKSAVGLDAPETPRDISFCQFAIMGNEIFTVENALEDDRFKNNPLVTGAPDIRFYAGAPLIDSNGFALGTLCVIDRVPRKLDQNQQRALAILAKEVVSQLELRKEKEENLYFKKVFNYSHELICAYSKDGIINRANDHLTQTLNYTLDELVGSSINPYIHPDDLEITLTEIQRLLTTGEVITFINRIKNKNNDYLYVSWNSFVDYNTYEIVAVGRNITEQVLVEQKLQESQARLKESQTISKIGSWEFDLNTHEQIWSSEHYRIFEIEEPQSQENLYNLYRSRIHPDDISELDRVVNEALALGKDFTYEHRANFDNGKRIKYVLGIGNVQFDSEGKPYKLVGTAQDITDRKLTETKAKYIEDRWKFAIEGNGDGLWDWDIPSGTVYYSDQWKRMIGYEPHEIEDTLETWSSHIHPDDIAEAYHQIDLHLKNEKPLYSHEQRIRCKDGSYKWVLDRGRIIEWDENGKPIRMIGTNTDLTSRKQYEYTILENQKRLFEAQKIAKLGNWQFNVKTYEVKWSPELVSIFEIEPEEITSNYYNRYRATFNEVELAIFDEALNNTLSTGEPYKVEHMSYFDNGKRIKYIVSSGYLERNEDGEPIMLYGVTHDITERKIIELELNEKQKSLNDAQKLAKIGNWQYDFINKIIVWSDELYNIFEIDKATPAEDLFGLYTARYTEDELLILQSLVRRAIETGEGYEIEHKAVFNDGKRIKYILGKGEAVKDENGNVVSLVGIAQDITERKLMELQQKEAELKWMFAIEGAGDGLWDWNIEKSEVFFSPQWKKMLGFEIDEIGNTLNEWSDRLHPEDSQKVFSDVNNYLENKTDFYENEHRVLCKDGSFKYILDRGKIVERDAFGKPLRMIGTHHDLTKRVALEEQLRINEERWGFALNASGDGIWDWSPITNKTHYSKRWIEIIGYSENELTDETSEWSSRIHPLDVEMTYKQIAENLEGITESFEFEYRFKHKNGNYIWILNRGKVVQRNADGVATRVVGTHTDISERKLIEEQLKLAKDNLNTTFEAITEGIVLQNLEGEIIECNPAAERILGLTRQQMEGKKSVDPDWRAIHEDGSDYPGETHPAMRTLTTGESIFNDVMGVHKPNGELTWININSVKLPNDRGVVTSFADITDAKKAEREIIHAKNAAEAASVAKSEFLANMSHEIRTPLNGVIGFSDLLMNTNLDTTQQLYIDTINNSAKSLLDIINDILDFSKIEAGKLELETISTDVEQLLITASNIVSYQCQTKNLELLLNITPEIPQLIWTDATRLRQVIVNLLSNAVKFTQNGEVELKVDVLQKTDKTSKLRFAIKDTGVGIAPEKLQSIFSAFSQEDTSTTRKFGGTGLGLTISNKLLELMGGTAIQVESELGKGSTFYFDVEFKSENNNANLTFNLSHLQHILIVDDNEKTNQIITQIIEKHNITSEFVTDGIDALYNLKKGAKYDAIIIDYNLSDMDGIEVITKIRANSNPEIAKMPIVLTYSSSEQNDLYNQCLQLGVRQQILKPINSIQLLNALSKVNILEDDIVLDFVNEEVKIVESTNAKTVLIVDDNKINILLARTIVSKLLPDAMIMEALDGDKAVRLSKEYKFDIIFMDVQMPILNGYQSAETIRNAENGGKRVPIIALTAGTVLGEKERCLRAGMDDYISKPFTKEAIENVLKTYLSE